MYCFVIEIFLLFELRIIFGVMVILFVVLCVRGGLRNCFIREIVDILYNEVFFWVLLGDDWVWMFLVVWVDEFDDLGGDVLKYMFVWLSVRNKGRVF